ncbi:hypothetical protein [Streptomyces afghaniensis 772] [Streptomyces afghaniensis]
MNDQPTAQRATPLSSTPAPVFSRSAWSLLCGLRAHRCVAGPVRARDPRFRAEFGLSPSAAGLRPIAHFVGGVAGVLLFDRLYGRVGNRYILGSSYLLMAVGAAGFALAPGWPTALAAALLAGLGFGGIDYGLNQLFAVGFGHRSTASC